VATAWAGESIDSLSQPFSLISIESVSFNAGDGAAINPFSLKIAEGEIVGIASGSRVLRTGFLRLLSGESTLGSGRILFAGRDISYAPYEARCLRGIIRAPAVSAIIPELTVIENVMLGRAARPAPFYPRDGRPSHEEEAKAALELAGLAKAANRAAGDLQLAQKHALALAMAMANKPSLLLVEDTGEERAAADHIANLLSGIRDEGVTVLIAAQADSRCLDICDRVELLHNPAPLRSAIHRATVALSRKVMRIGRDTAARGTAG
jgi:ABC-type branched-subunit amino acid transport system ATPase component